MALPHEPTDEQRKKVEQYSAVGIPHLDIARMIGITDKTLRLHYRDELDLGSIKANAAVGGALYNKCLSGDTTAMIWWTKVRMKWQDKQQVEHTGAVQQKHTIDDDAKEYLNDLFGDGGGDGEAIVED